MLNKPNLEELFFICGKFIDDPRQNEQLVREIGIYVIESHMKVLKENVESMNKQFDERKSTRKSYSDYFVDSGMQSFYEGEDSTMDAWNNFYNSKLNHLNKQLIEILK